MTLGDLQQISVGWGSMKLYVIGWSNPSHQLPSQILGLCRLLENHVFNTIVDSVPSELGIMNGVILKKSFISCHILWFILAVYTQIASYEETDKQTGWGTNRGVDVRFVRIQAGGVVRRACIPTWCPVTPTTSVCDIEIAGTSSTWNVPQVLLSDVTLPRVADWMTVLQMTWWSNGLTAWQLAFATTNWYRLH